MPKRYCVVIGDVVDSRSVDDREMLHRDLERGVECANDALADQMIAPFVILKGVDEIGGVLPDPSRVYRAIREINEAVHPTAIRFAVVQGRIDVGASKSDIVSMDGPAFHEADTLLDTIAHENQAIALSDPDVDPWLRQLIAHQIDLLLAWKQKWTPHQGAVVRQYRNESQMKAIAEQRDVSIQTVSQTLSRTGIERIIRTEKSLEKAMVEVWRDST